MLPRPEHRQADHTNATGLDGQFQVIQNPLEAH